MSKCSLKLILIATDGPLTVGMPEHIGNRATIHIQVASPPIPSAAIATTLSTGTSALVHGILHYRTLDVETVSIREAIRADRRAQAFWDGSDLVVKTVNWPAVIGDSQVSNIQSNHEFPEALDCVDADILGIVLPNLSKEIDSADKLREVQQQLEVFIADIHEDVNIVIVHRKTEKDGSVKPLVRPLIATFCVGQQEVELNGVPFIELVGGASFLLAGRSCPIGVNQPNWNFLEPFKSEKPREFSIPPQGDAVQWGSLIEAVIQQKKVQETELLINRFLYLLFIAFKKEDWKEVEQHSVHLLKLRGRLFDYWMWILSLEQKGKFEELQKAIDELNEVHPNSDINVIAKGLVRLDSDTANETLQNMDYSKISIPQSIGAFGRLCFKADLHELGTDAIHFAISRGVATSADRAQLASRLYDLEKYDDGLRVLRGVGIGRSEISWQVLRLKLLAALEREDDSIRIANQILEQNSTNEVALTVIEKFKNRS